MGKRKYSKLDYLNIKIFYLQLYKTHTIGDICQMFVDKVPYMNPHTVREYISIWRKTKELPGRVKEFPRTYNIVKFR